LYKAEHIVSQCKFTYFHMYWMLERKFNINLDLLLFTFLRHVPIVQWILLNSKAFFPWIRLPIKTLLKLPLLTLWPASGLDFCLNFRFVMVTFSYNSLKIVPFIISVSVCIWLRSMIWIPTSTWGLSVKSEYKCLWWATPLVLPRVIP